MVSRPLNVYKEVYCFQDKLWKMLLHDMLFILLQTILLFLLIWLETYIYWLIYVNLSPIRN